VLAVSHFLAASSKSVFAGSWRLCLLAIPDSVPSEPPPSHQCSVLTILPYGPMFVCFATLQLNPILFGCAGALVTGWNFTTGGLVFEQHRYARYTASGPPRLPHVRYDRDSPRNFVALRLHKVFFATLRFEVLYSVFEPNSRQIHFSFRLPRSV
jgi:hypothetical protein